MAVYALTSLVGAPGVSTLATAWAAHSPRPTLIVEADITGGSTLMTGIWKGAQPHAGGITALASASHDTYVETIWEQALRLPQREDRWLLPGIGRGTHSNAVRTVWSPLAAALHQISRQGGVDVIIDAGRLGLAHGPWPLIDEADAVLLLSDATLRSLTTLSIALPSLRADLDLTGSHRRLGVVPRVAGPTIARGIAGLRGRQHHEPDARPYRAGEISASTDPTPLIGSLPYDPRGAGIYLDGAGAPTQPRSGGHYAAAVRHLIAATERHDHAYRSLLDTQDAS